MKNYEEMAESVFRRSERILKEKEQNRRKLRSAGLVALAVTLVVGLCGVAGYHALSGKENVIPPVGTTSSVLETGSGEPSEDPGMIDPELPVTVMKLAASVPLNDEMDFQYTVESGETDLQVEAFGGTFVGDTKGNLYYVDYEKIIDMQSGKMIAWIYDTYVQDNDSIADAILLDGKIYMLRSNGDMVIYDIKTRSAKAVKVFDRTEGIAVDLMRIQGESQPAILMESFAADKGIWIDMNGKEIDDDSVFAYSGHGEMLSDVKEKYDDGEAIHTYNRFIDVIDLLNDKGDPYKEYKIVTNVEIVTSKEYTKEDGPVYWYVNRTLEVMDKCFEKVTDRRIFVTESGELWLAVGFEDHIEFYVLNAVS